MRTHFCGLVDEGLIGHAVTLCGWVNTNRVQSHVVFTDLRDHEGVVQIVVDSDMGDLFRAASGLSLESCVRVQGTVRARQAANDKIRSGKVEVIATAIEVLNKADPLPFHAHENPGEDIRLKYRYLDMRRPEMQKMMRTRIALVQSLRRWLDARGFQDIETPILTKATPEGARDFLVPARMHAGEFYALPQSPQLFKQILMMAGFDRYYQIARCFRDEALRADRQLEFTQLDMEFAWVSERDVQDTTEELIRTVFKEVMDVELVQPFPRLTYAEAMRRYGSDKPDLRIDLELVDIADLVKSCEFKVFTDWASHAEGRVAALRVPGGAELSRKQIDDCAAHAAKHGAKGLAWMKVSDRSKGREGITSPIAKFLDDATLNAVLDAVQAQSGDILFFGAGPWKSASDFMGALRLKVAKDLSLVAKTWQPLWVTDFPMFEWDEEDQRYVALHHPFTAPAVDGRRRTARRCKDRGLARLRHGAQRQRDRRRFDPHPSLGHAVGGVRLARHHPRGGGAEVRLPARSAALRRPAARWHRVRHRPHRRADGRHRIDPRRDRVPEDDYRAMPDDRGAVAGAGQAARRGAYLGAHEGKGRRVNVRGSHSTCRCQA